MGMNERLVLTARRQLAGEEQLLQIFAFVFRVM